MLKTAPAVFAVENEYQIMVSTTRPVLFSVLVDGEEYFDESNGILRSLSDLHRVKVPMSALDKAGKYVVRVRPLIERKPYFTETEEPVEFMFPFYPVPTEGLRVYHISDAHNRRTMPVAAANAFGDFDLLILNGDVIDHSGDPSKFDNVYDICSRLTHGAKPVVFSRGNHDMRGNYAERFADYTPNAGGNTYYTFRLGGLWGIVLDCGEDKLDYFPEYGHTVCCAQFRRRQTAFLRRVIENKEREYAAEGVTHRLVVSHVPFTTRFGEPFNIEEDVYTEWARLLREEVKPDLMLCGHVHRIGVWEVGGAKDSFGQPCPVVVGARPEKERFSACGLTFGTEGITVTFTDSTGAVLDEKTV